MRIKILKDTVKSWEKVPGEPFGELLRSRGTFWRTFSECKDPAPQMEGSQWELSGTLENISFTVGNRKLFVCDFPLKTACGESGVKLELHQGHIILCSSVHIWALDFLILFSSGFWGLFESSRFLRLLSGRGNFGELSGNPRITWVLWFDYRIELFFIHQKK